MSRRSYDKQFKMAAVKLVLEDNMPVAEVSKVRGRRIVFMHRTMTVIMNKI